MIYYKVVQRHRNKLRSSMADLLQSWALTYQPNVKVTAWDNSRIFIFKTFGHAKVFVSRANPSNLEIWECEAECVGHILPVSLHLFSAEDDIDKYWELKRKKKQSQFDVYYWDGCCSARAITLIRKIEWSGIN